MQNRKTNSKKQTRAENLLIFLNLLICKARLLNKCLKQKTFGQEDFIAKKYFGKNKPQFSFSFFSILILHSMENVGGIIHRIADFDLLGRSQFYISIWTVILVF